MLTLAALHEANIARQSAWCPDENKQPSLSFRGNELAGETGEACNVIKKLERERHGWAGSRDTLEHLAEELADVVICADLCAITAGVDLQAAVVAKFNATSQKVGLPHRLEPVSVDAPGGQVSEADAKWLRGWLMRQIETGHCGEGTFESRERAVWNDRIYRVCDALEPKVI